MRSCPSRTAPTLRPSRSTVRRYPRLSPTSEWDTGAAQAVLTAAGGAVVTAARESLRYNAKAEIRNPFFIAYGDGGRDWVGLLR